MTTFSGGVKLQYNGFLMSDFSFLFLTLSLLKGIIMFELIWQSNL